MQKLVTGLLKSIVHPETGENIVDGGFVETVTATDEKITVSLLFKKARDPFAVKIKGQVQALLEGRFPQLKESITIFIKEGAPAKPKVEKRTTTGSIRNIVAIASGKGGVGKSTVTANLAVTLRDMGYRVGLLDADIYGPSQPKMFGCEGYLPDAVQEDGFDYIVPAEVAGIKLISIGFFIKPTDALIWRGTMACNALRQLIHQTQWGELDFLLIDLPPGTGDIHLSIISELKISGAVIVSSLPETSIIVSSIILFISIVISVDLL
jgi:ATP-binding protein involved in chromosome partitioning